MQKYYHESLYFDELVIITREDSDHIQNRYSLPDHVVEDLISSLTTRSENRRKRGVVLSIYDPDCYYKAKKILFLSGM